MYLSASGAIHILTTKGYPDIYLLAPAVTCGPV